MIPLVDYAISYSYIITELCEQREEVDNNCMGMCHLSKEIKKQTEIPKNKTLANIEFIKIPHLNEIKSSIDSNILPKSIRQIKIFENEIKNFFKPITPPPKLIFC